VSELVENGMIHLEDGRESKEEICLLRHFPCHDYSTHYKWGRRHRALFSRESDLFQPASKKMHANLTYSSMMSGRAGKQ
jgi:hypothetical protein